MTTTNANLNTAVELTPEEAAAVTGGRSRQNAGRRVSKKITRENIVKQKRVKKGIYSVRYRANVTQQKNTFSRNNYSSSNSFNF